MFRGAGEHWPVVIPEEELRQPFLRIKPKKAEEKKQRKRKLCSYLPPTPPPAVHRHSPPLLCRRFCLNIFVTGHSETPSILPPQPPFPSPEKNGAKMERKGSTSKGTLRSHVPDSFPPPVLPSPVKLSAEKDNQWFQLSMEEAFYLFYVLKCIKVLGEDKCEKSCEDLWMYMKSNEENFPNLFKAYSHLRMKNWVVRSGCQYGVDFVAYRHHPSLVHAEYAVIVLSDGNGEPNGRLMVWSDLQCTLRLCGSVAKTLLVLYIDKCGKKATSPSCLESYIVEERTTTRWCPEQCRENQTNSCE